GQVPGPPLPRRRRSSPRSAPGCGVRPHGPAARHAPTVSVITSLEELMANADPRSCRRCRRSARHERHLPRRGERRAAAGDEFRVESRRTVDVRLSAGRTRTRRARRGGHAHGCTQTAADYHAHAGWRDLADRAKFAVIYPEQRTTNNLNRCFNWFQPGDSDRGQGEAASIRQMVAHAVTTYDLNPDRVFATGLSAGGAMTANLLADYPDVFRAGAIMAGVPAKGAGALDTAYSGMGSDQRRTPGQWADLVRRSAPDHPGSWPTVAIFHGTADTTVAPVNADELRDQWTAVHGVSQEPSRT